MVVLDTSVIIDHLRQPSGTETWLQKIAKKIAKENLAISVISVQELYEGKSMLDPRKENYLLATITPLRILPYTFETAQLAGQIARELPRPIELADAAIAATAILAGAELLTLDRKDFLGISQLDLVEER